MKDSLAIGVTTTRKFTIDRERTIGFMGDEGRVYSTPSMVRDIEYTCHELLMEHVDDGENSVGTHVSIDHIGATVEGDEVEVSITITAVEGRAISFEANVKDSLEDVGRGVHNRFVVDVIKTHERLTEKRKKVMGS
ncbi:MAG: LysR family transcriptional regulator [Rhodospirillaceae bacterium TMED167]|nr:LysR family transcriptional regulator [Rhodospirillaceae bacterium]OUW24791.1 MAG: LysR family transcriptional regulator [Rhodospirillaceae bacterium TMED167]